MSGATKRRASGLKGTSRGGFENVDAENLHEYYNKPASWTGSDGDKEGVYEPSRLTRIFGLTGKYKTPGAGVILQAATMEILGSLLISFTVGLARWGTGGGSGNVLADGLFMGLVYGASYYAASMLPSDFTLRRHLNIGISAGYAMQNEIGLLGFLFYGVCQFLGLMAGGGLIQALLNGSAVSGTNRLPRITVPYPQTTFTSYGSVVAFEFVGAVVLFAFFLIKEFNMTSFQNRVKNYHHAVKTKTVVLIVLVAFMYQFQIFTWSNVAYGGGWFSGANVAQPQRSIVNLCDLNSDIFPDSVFGPATGGYKGAAAMYLLMPALAGIAASLLSLVIFLLKAKSFNMYDVAQSEANKKWLSNEDEPEKVGADIGTRFAQTQLSDMSTPFLQK
jgi:hypothetical protein